MEQDKLEENIKIIFERIDDLRDGVKEANDRSKWQGSYLQSELGFRPTLDSPPTEGNFKRANEESFEAIDTTLHGSDGRFGVATKVDIMWKAHFPIWAAITSSITGLIVFIITKVVK